MRIPTEPIGSIPRPLYLIDAMDAFSKGELSPAELKAKTEQALRDTIKLFEETGSPVINRWRTKQTQLCDISDSRIS